jgi:benzoyl-CoA 2,3-dioxygenase component B
VFAGHHVAPTGVLTDSETWNEHRAEWLPTHDDFDYVASLMQPVYAPGRSPAGWRHLHRV